MTFPHWQYYLTLEKDVEVISRYIELTPTNSATHSIELVRILLAASSEVDVVAGLICNEIDSTISARNLADYRSIIASKYPRFYSIEVIIPRFDLSFNPWKSWGDDLNPAWWQDHNRVKHDRSTYYSKASLENTLNAVAGLFAIVLYMYKDNLHKLNPWPRLFSLPGDAWPSWLYAGRFHLPDFDTE